MAEEQIKITIDKNGSFHAETHGLKGQDCLDALDELLGNLVEKIDDVKLTNEYKQPPNTCLLYTSPSPRDATLSRMPSSA